MNVGESVEYQTGEGGSVTMIADTNKPSNTGVEGGWAYWNDILLRSPNNLFLDISSADHRVVGGGVHSTTRSTISFDIETDDASPTLDCRLTGLKPDSRYALEISGYVRKCDGGETLDVSTAEGTLSFSNIRL